MRHQPNGRLLMLVFRILLFSVAAMVFVLIFIDTGGTPMQMEIEDIMCDDIQFVAYNGVNETAGRKFSCSLQHYLDDWKLSEWFAYEFEPINASQVVFVTYSSSNHFNESRKAIQSIRSQFQNKIVYFDLGLEKEQVAELNNVCNLQVRKFNFSQYPNFVTNLSGYNFKPIIMAEVFREFENYWIMDTSIRFFNVTPFLTDFYTQINTGVIETIALKHHAGHSIFATTDPRMYEYLPIDENLAKKSSMLEAGTAFIARSELSREAVKWYALCALTLDCMAPPQSDPQCDFASTDRFSTFVKCHRYDQSAMNLILSSLLYRDGWNRSTVEVDSMKIFTSVERADYGMEPLSIPCN